MTSEPCNQTHDRRSTGRTAMLRGLGLFLSPLGEISIRPKVRTSRQAKEAAASSPKTRSMSAPLVSAGRSACIPAMMNQDDFAGLAGCQPALSAVEPRKRPLRPAAQGDVFTHIGAMPKAGQHGLALGRGAA